MIKFLVIQSWPLQNIARELFLTNSDCFQSKQVVGSSLQLGFRKVVMSQSKTYLTSLDGESLSNCLMHLFPSNLGAIRFFLGFVTCCLRC